MVGHTTDMMVDLVTDHQDRLRTLKGKHGAQFPDITSPLRRVTGQTLIRLGEQIRGEHRDATPAISRTRMVAS